jgi:hypothetical protein
VFYSSRRFFAWAIQEKLRADEILSKRVIGEQAVWRQEIAASELKTVEKRREAKQFWSSLDGYFST